MSTAIKGLDRLMKRLSGVSSGSKSLFDALVSRVMARTQDIHIAAGFLEGATYPDGTPVAAVAAYNEFGGASHPARPFMRATIEKNRDRWGALLSASLRATGGDLEKALSMTAEKIVSQIQDEIRGWQDPPNAPVTIAQKGFDKPLIDTGHMLNSVGYEVSK